MKPKDLETIAKLVQSQMDQINHDQNCQISSEKWMKESTFNSADYPDSVFVSKTPTQEEKALSLNTIFKRHKIITFDNSRSSVGSSDSK